METSAGGGTSTQRGSLGRLADPGVLASVFVLVIGSYATLSVDVVRTGRGIKGDEATYIAMALSVAYDGDLNYEAEDIDRFYQIYNTGPEGIFLKRGSDGSYRFDGVFPFLHRDTQPEDRADRLYFGKAYVYSVAAAPFVWVAGLNGLLLFNVFLVAVVVFAGYRFLAARSPGGLAAGYTLGFFGASIVPLYGVWLTSELFNVACVFLAYVLWFYKEVAPPADGRFARWLRSPASNIAAAVLLGIATFSKPPNGILILPPLALALWRRQPRVASLGAMVFALVVGAGFAVNAGISGEFNYQGGNRRSFYGEFPFERPGDNFEALGLGVATNAVIVEEPLAPGAFLTLLGNNLRYFLVGRHFGFLPFFFPGIVTVLLFLWHRATREMWQWAILASVVLCAVGLAVYMPYTWSGGGGPSGNRYFLSIYPALFFITPPLASLAPVVLAWLGGTLFTAHILINPFVSAKQPYSSAERGMLRLLPVELTMVNDLPIVLDGPRSRVPHGSDPTLLLYYLDHNAYRPDPAGFFWVAGGRRADIIVRSGPELVRVTATLRSRVANNVTVELGGASQTVELEPGVPQRITFEPDGVYSRRSWAYVLSVEPDVGFVPRLASPDSRDPRYLGVAVTLAATEVADGNQEMGGG